jgi:hypothetical protein
MTDSKVKTHIYVKHGFREKADLAGSILRSKGVDVDNPQNTGKVSRSAVIEYLLDWFLSQQERIANEGAKAHVINEAFLTGGNS